MIPVLFRIGDLPVRSYGVMLALSFLLGSWLAIRSGARRGVAEDRTLSLIVWILLASIVGSRLHFVLSHPSSFRAPLDLFRIWEGGLTLYGGLVAAILTSFLYLRRHRISFLAVADACAPSIALGEGITRIGCFVNGCCFGSPCEGALFCFRYPRDSYAWLALGDLPVHPAQLYLSASMLALFVLLWRLDRRGLPAGVLFGIYLALQGAARYLVDFYRYYEPVDRLAGGPLLVAKSQLVAIALVVCGLVLIAVRARRNRSSRPGEGHP